MTTRELDGRVAIVTGAGRNIGRMIALHLADAGASVVINARSNKAEAESVARENSATNVKLPTRFFICRVLVIANNCQQVPRIRDGTNRSPLRVGNLRKFEHVLLTGQNRDGHSKEPLSTTFQSAERDNKTPPGLHTCNKRSNYPWLFSRSRFWMKKPVGKITACQVIGRMIL